MGNAELLKSLVGVLGVPVIVGLVEIAKKFVSDGRLYPIIAVVLGLVINITIYMALGYASTVDVITAVFQGVLAGLAASGLYSANSTFRNP